jgi:hypothetical protein
LIFQAPAITTCQLPGHEWPGLQLLFVTGCHASRRAGDR